MMGDKIHARHVKMPDLSGSDYDIGLRLSRWVAYNLARDFADHATIVLMIEGGIWQDPGFMPRTSCIWTSLPGSEASISDARKSNYDAANFIAQADMEIDTFILTAKLLQETDSDNLIDRTRED